MNEYRITRQELWGGIKVSNRQGHYIRATCIHEAIKLMEQSYPGETFDVQLWQHNLLTDFPLQQFPL